MFVEIPPCEYLVGGNLIKSDSQFHSFSPVSKKSKVNKGENLLTTAS
jgi:hypothetical protein